MKLLQLLFAVTSVQGKTIMFKFRFFGVFHLRSVKVNLVGFSQREHSHYNQEWTKIEEHPRTKDRAVELQKFNVFWIFYLFFLNNEKIYAGCDAQIFLLI